MADDHSAAFIAFALEVHNLEKRAGVRDRYVQNIRDWIEAGQTANDRLREQSAPIVAQLLKGEEPDSELAYIPHDGPAPLYERSPWSVCQCYVATAIIHDAFLEDLRTRTIDAVEPICPPGREYLIFRMLTVRDQGRYFFNDCALFEDVLRDALTRVKVDLGNTDLTFGNFEGPVGTKPSTKPKRSTAQGDARAKIIPALTEHHQYENGSCLIWEPIGVNKLARSANVANASTSRFFSQQFEGHHNYRAACADKTRLIHALKILNGELTPKILFQPRSGDVDAGN